MMEHSVMPSFDDSIVTYGGIDWIKCNRASPIIHASIRSVLFLTIKEKNYGDIFCAPITK